MKQLFINASRASIILGLAISAPAQLSAAEQPTTKPCVRTVFVSPAGSDAWSGALAEPTAGRDDGPLLSPERALENMASCLDAPAGPRRIIFRGGVYYLEHTLAVSPAIAGVGSSPIALEAYEGERPTISGGREIKNWAVGTDGRWRTKLSEVESGAWRFSQLFVDGQRRDRPRYPTKGYLAAVASNDPSDDVRALGHNRFTFDPRRFPNDALLGAAAELFVFHSWTTSRLPVAEIDRSHSVLTARGHTFTSGGDGKIKQGTRYFFDNVSVSELQPGQWHLDYSTGELTYNPLPGDSPEVTTIVAPRLTELLQIGSPYGSNQIIAQIKISGIVFAHTNWNMPPQGRSSPQAEVGLPAAIEIGAAENVTLDRIAVLHTGAHAIAISSSSSRVHVQNGEMRDLGAGGLQIGTPNVGASVPAPQNTSPVLDRDRVIVDHNLISEGGRVSPGAVAIWIGHMDNVTIHNNEISDFYYSGISVGWTWGYGKSGAHDNTIVGNHIHGIGKGVLSDLGGIYTLGASSGTIVANNVVHDVRAHDYGGWGIYADQGTASLRVYNNLVYRTRDGGFHIHYGKSNSVDHNIFALGDYSEVRCSRSENHISVVFQYNIILHRASSPIFLKKCNEKSFTSDHNVYWTDGSTGNFSDTDASFEDWIKNGHHDENSLEIDPGFVDVDKGDFQFRRGSLLRGKSFGPRKLPAAVVIFPALTYDLPIVRDTFQ